MTSPRPVRPSPPQRGILRPLFRLLRFLGGLAYLLVVTVVFGIATGAGFVPTLLAVLAGAAFCTTLALIWLTRWALRDDTRSRQFGLGSLFFLTTFAAVYFGFVRWLVVHATPMGAAFSKETGKLFLVVGVISLVLAAIAVPFLFGMAESLVWLAVWIVRRRVVRRWLSRGRGSEGDE